MADRATLARARQDLATFARLIDRPMTEWQVDALRLRTRITTVVSARQLGKSRSLATLALWFAFSRPGSVVLVVSASEDAALRLLGEARGAVLGSELLAGSVVDERAALVRLSNRSEIRSVPASERAIRGQRVSLLLVDEATQIGEDLLVSAALPTVAAQADGRVVLASSPLGAAGPFYAFAMAGEEGDPDVSTFRWRLIDAPWIDSGFVEAARRSMSAQRFRAEFLGEFALGSGDFIDVSQVVRVSSVPCRLDDCVTGPDRVDDCVLGLDPGSSDGFGAVVVGAAVDAPARLRVAHVELLDPRSFTGAVDRAAEIAEQFAARVVSDQHGAAMLAERLRARGIPVRVTPWAATSGPRAVGRWEAYASMRGRLLEGTLELLDDPVLLAELAALQVQATAGAWRVVSPRRAGSHGDLASALALAVAECREPPEWRRAWLSEEERARVDFEDALEAYDRAERVQEARLRWGHPKDWAGGSVMGDLMNEKM